MKQVINDLKSIYLIIKLGSKLSNTMFFFPFRESQRGVAKV